MTLTSSLCTTPFKPGEGISYNNPSALSVRQTEFELELRGDRCVAKLSAHYSTTDAARLVVDPFLRAWEIECALNGSGRPQLQFQFKNAEVIERSPSQHSPTQTVDLTGVAATGAVGTLSVQITLRHYPSPPAYRANADLETLWFRYSLYKTGA
jgi:hypothetical protein